MDIGQPIKALRVDEEHNIYALSNRKVSVFRFPCSLTKNDQSTIYSLHPAPQVAYHVRKADDKVYVCKISKNVSSKIYDKKSNKMGPTI